MRLNKWLGWVSTASPYALPPGTAVEQINCMSVVPGQLTVRGGSKVIAKSTDRCNSLWGYSVGFGKTETVVGFTESGKVTEFTNLGSGTSGLKITDTDFNGSRPVNFAQGRRGEVYVYQGYGKRGKIRGLDGTYRPVGLDAPDEAPVVQVSKKVASYVARIDIIDPGNGYHAAPSVNIEAPTGGGGKQAKAISRIASSQVSEVDVTDGGAGYTKTPWVEFKAPEGTTITGGGASAKLSLAPGFSKGSHKTGVVFWEITELPFYFWPCLTGLQKEGKGYIVPAKSKSGKGSGAKAIFWLPSRSDFKCGNPNEDDVGPVEINGITVQVYDFGEGYDPSDEITAEIPIGTGFTVNALGGTTINNCGGARCQLVATGYLLNSPGCPDVLTVIEENPYKQRPLSPTLQNAGSGYLTPPIFVTDDGDIIKTEISKEGAVTKLIVDDPSKLYLWAPELVRTEGNVGLARALAIMRPIFRGKYQCYYRYVDESIPESAGGPLFSNLSPVTEVDCGDGSDSIVWSYEKGPGTAVELWRTTADQATVLFRVAKIGGEKPFGSTTDTLSDYDVANPTREGFQAMPIVLSDGSLNANRFGIAPSNFAVGVVFQDRTWLGVDTSGLQPNTLMYSEADEPEAVPDVNELILQTNLRDTDYITALIPYAGALVVAQSRHCHRLSFVNSPAIDATTSLIAYRGCINQRCWDIYQGIAYMLDDVGLYSLDPQGNVDYLSYSIDSLFRVNPDATLPTIDFSKREWFFVRADRNMGVIRIHVAFVGDTGKYPTRQVVFDPDSKAFWIEQYPATFSAATEVRSSDGSIILIHAGDEGLYQFGVGLTDSGTPIYFSWKSINFEFITDKDRGGGQQNSRNVSVVYKPTKDSCRLHLSVYYNGSKTPRANVARRDRGVGFVHSDTRPLAYVDMQIQPEQEAESHGVARALFAGKTLEDFAGADTHIAFRLFGQQNDAGDVVIHALDLQGLAEPGA